jgi:hypothetical protein
LKWTWEINGSPGIAKSANSVAPTLRDCRPCSQTLCPRFNPDSTSRTTCMGQPPSVSTDDNAFRMHYRGGGQYGLTLS